MFPPAPSQRPTDGSGPAAPASGAAASGAAAPQPRSAWWVRLLSRVPFPALYRLADLLGWLAFRVFPHREEVVRTNLSQCFPELDEAGRREVRRSYYAGFADVLVEVIKSATISPAEIRSRVRVVGLEQPQALLAAGQSVLLAAAHQCNWEWMLLSLSLELGYPLDAAYKPLVDSWAEREMKKVRSRFGSRLVPAKDLLADIIRRGKVVRAVAMVADQEPTTSEHKHWTRFLNRDTAFYMGPEEIARVTRFPVFFIGMKRTARGFYELRLVPLSARGESLRTGDLTERYVRLVEQQIREAPADWPWSHKRWKLKKSLYQGRGSGR
ncbi:MAG TPA: lysophospholipid acyltransferase family protein [Steroidobacteraceae bacterium]